ncbi:hypothetical protein [Simiduia aestuariiviva]|uniref:Uncharacterized protein n=1 Tax=Simiduia aestuariiviva TaxID=1510459 RepID=A0A839UVI3_9GAMM|nr:hypothetical protein [Simiduia aestuariiviva]MBB3169478.1 hypothetical protein [Simiduia aestuariiviva]
MSLLKINLKHPLNIQLIFYGILPHAKPYAAPKNKKSQPDKPSWDAVYHRLSRDFSAR